MTATIDLADPHPTYHQLREASPMFELPDGGWILTGYDACYEALRLPELSSESRARAEYERWRRESGRDNRAQDVAEVSMLFRDPPAHTRLRGLVQRAFTPKVITGLEPTIKRVADELLADLSDGPIELISDFAWPLPVIVIAHMLGVPAADRDLFRGWAADLAWTVEPVLSEEIRARVDPALIAFEDYFTELAAERRRRPQDDLVTALVETEDEGDRLNEVELLANLILLLIAGHETTMNLIGNAVYALVRRREQMQLLRAHGVDQRAIDEFLRFDGPVHITQRHAKANLRLAEHDIAAGESVLILLAAANRDPARFHRPDQLNVTRHEARPLSFGGGAHYCLGNALARLEGQMALQALLDRFRSIELVNEPTYRRRVTLRGLESIEVHLSE